MIQQCYNAITDDHDSFEYALPDFAMIDYVPDQVRTLSQVGTSSYMAYAM